MALSSVGGMTPGSCACSGWRGTDMASTRRCPLTLLLAATCLLHTAAVTGKGLPAWTGLSASGGASPTGLRSSADGSRSAHQMQRESCQQRQLQR